jgi:PAS domain S-box-containing protein
MDQRASHAARLRCPGRLLALALSYVVLGRLGLAIAPVSGVATLVWPPAGLSLAALVVGGYRLWPAVAAGSLATSLWLGAPPLAAMGVAAGDTLAAALGAFALRRLFDVHGSFDRSVEVLVLAVPIATVSTVVSATAGTASLALGGLVAGADFAQTWLVWWIGDLVSDAVVAPFFLTWAWRPRVATRPRRPAEIAALAALLVASAAFVFAQRHDTLARMHVVTWGALCFPLIWAALRLGARGAATAILVVTVIAVWGTSTGRGIFASADVREGLMNLQVALVPAALGMLALGSAMSEREGALEAVRAARARLSTIVESTADAIIGEAQGTITSWNAAAERLYGYSRDEAIGQPISTLVSSEERTELAFLFDQVRRGERFSNHETVGRRKDGRLLDVAISLAPIRDAAGAVAGTSVVARDIAECVERWRLASEAAHLGMWCWSVKTTKYAWTPLCRSAHGIGVDEEASYARFVAALHPDDREQVERAIQRAIVEHADYRVEYRVVWPDQSLHWISALGCVFYDDQGEAVRMMGVSLDVTARKEAEEERSELLARAQAARAEAERAARAKDEFLAVLSHELRTPLQSMLGWAMLLKARPDDVPTMRRGLDTIERNVKAQARLIEDLLDVSRVVANKLRLERQRVDLAEVVEAALESAKTTADAKSIRIEATIEPMTGAVLGDAQRLQQVVSNLITNAVKFAPERGRVALRLERRGTTAMIAVEDNGCGIPPEFLPHVFDRFRQAEEGATTRRRGGLGLGLAIVRHLVEAHQGTVTAESPGEGRGATFTVALPLVSAERRALSDEGTQAGRSGDEDACVLDGLRVLVVDDDPDACDLLETVLRQEGADVLAVRSASAALDEIATFRPDVLLSDIGMPEEDGYALIRQLRARERSAHLAPIPALALTAFASRADREQALSLGFEAHLAKPASPQDLARTVAGLAGRGPDRAALLPAPGGAR